MKFHRRLRRTLCRFRKVCVALVSVSMLLATCIVYLVLTYRCSTIKSAQQIQHLCELYHRGEVAGNMCHKLCDEDNFQISHCGGNIVGKNVIVLRCLDCDVEYLVLKSQVDIEHWTRYNNVSFQHTETMQSMVNRGKEVLFRRFRSEFKTDLSKQTDVLSYLWRQNLNDFIGNATADTKHLTSVALQSILALVMQDEYANMLILKQAPFVPKMQGTCGPVYFVENTPSLVYLDYVLYHQGTIPEALHRAPKISWHERAHVALQLLQIFNYLERLKPPVFMCDLHGRNFGLDLRHDVTMLDIDRLKYGKLVPDDRVCNSDKDCTFLTCKGRCDLPSHTCIKGPINSHLQVACRNIFLTFIPAFGLLRYPPSHVADELRQLLNECSFPRRSEKLPWKSDGVLQQKLVALLHRSLV